MAGRSSNAPRNSFASSNQIAHVGATDGIETVGQLHERRIAPLSDRGHDLGDCQIDIAGVCLDTGECVEFPGETGRAAVQTPNLHSLAGPLLFNSR